MSHPARFSKPILDVFADILLSEYPEWMGRPRLHDSFAGTGERLAELAERCGFYYSGTEIEASFIGAAGIIHGDATDPSTYPSARFPNEPGWVQVTSPVYANGMADHAVANDASKRYTYRKAIETIEGRDRPLAETNMAAYGYRGTKRGGSSQKRKRYWQIAEDAVKLWSSAELVLLNVSDFVSGGVLEPHVDDWKTLLYEQGWNHQTNIPVGTQRMRNGQNHEVRVDCEYVVVARKERA